MKNKFMLPRLDNYYSDYLQLSFYFEKKDQKLAYYSFEEDNLGRVYSQVMAINLAKIPINPDTEEGFEFFLNLFISLWHHEFLHLIGLSEEGVTKAKKLGFPCS